MLISNVMTEHVMTVSPDATIFEVAQLMRDEDIGAVPVADGKRLVGMVSIGDLSGKAPLAKAGDSLNRISWPASH